VTLGRKVRRGVKDFLATMALKDLKAYKAFKGLLVMMELPELPGRRVPPELLALLVLAGQPLSHSVQIRHSVQSQLLTSPTCQC
jgi:hypothetical protein